VLPTGEESRAEFGAWRDEIYSAAGVVVALLDDRIAQYELFDDFLVFDDEVWVGLADKRRNVRNFLPFPLTDADREHLESIATSEIPDNAMVVVSAWCANRAGP
jgi:hypothetical protein